MNTHTLAHPFLPELGTPRSGKVRDIYSNGDQLTMIASDRVSVFDRVFPEPIPNKGQILTELSHYWFDKTKHIIPNHLISHPDPNVMVVKKCTPILLEMIVRGYIVGSLWRDYSAGKRVKCGISLPDGLKQNEKLKEPIVTPTTKSEHGKDEDITCEELIAQGVVTQEIWHQAKEAALKLYKYGQEVLQSKGLILVDAKYEFGLDGKGELVLIDEIHTPDASRFWFQNEQELKFPDKEYLREWLRGQGYSGEGTPPALPHDVIEKVQEGYRQVFEAITGRPLLQNSGNVPKRLVSNLKESHDLAGVFALIVVGSESDQPHVDKIVAVLNAHNVPSKTIISSAHKHPRAVLEVIDQYNKSVEPLVCLTVAGRSNALSGMMAANVKWPVIACPPFKDHSDYLTNIHSSLQMPSKVPVLTVIDPGNAALAAIRILKAMEMS